MAERLASSLMRTRTSARSGRNGSHRTVMRLQWHLQCSSNLKLGSSKLRLQAPCVNVKPRAVCFVQLCVGIAPPCRPRGFVALALLEMHLGINYSLLRRSWGPKHWKKRPQKLGRGRKLGWRVCLLVYLFKI
jgi:hypothetical protein